MSEDILAALADVLNACTRTGLAHAVIGAVARNAWAPPRATTDADVAVIVPPGAYEQLKAALRKEALTIRREISCEPDAAVPDVVLLDAPVRILRRVDLLIAATEFEREAIDQAVERDIGIRCRVIRPEHLIVYKLIAGRPRDLDDVEMIIRTRRHAGEYLDVGLIRKWCTEWGVEERLNQIVATIGSP